MRSRSVTNVSWDLLDAPVIHGRGEDPFLEAAAGRTWTHARLLEEVAALGGLLHHLGVGPGVPVVVDLAEDHAVEAVVAALATARVGGVVRTDEDPAAPVAVVSGGTDAAPDGRTRLVRTREGEVAVEPDLDWSVMLRAGRTDPAACQVLEPGAAYSPTRSVVEQAEALAAEPAPYAPEALRRLLQV
ncbi:AMP-binding protein [Nocardioides aurantiacus]|uniref:AMP-binding enzyme n=1 Tax=Nocardioides aurantiacus TaxID=86796 RepID=A0A3N2CX94_9ACTN|nr:AMP-binding protein [Nocardioides aurantiacus]ROR92119.1 AMP-binding enzyme [Nocardioides aurantiacus]